MNRLIIAAISLLAILAVCMCSSITIESVKSNVEHGIIEIHIASKNPDTEAILEKVNELQEYWIQKESTLTNYVLKNFVESISQSMAKLYPLAEQEDWAAFYAELAAIGWLIDNIDISEKFTLSNIF